ncbi:MAG: phosphatase PAP2 family protein [Mogibacterium sp.]|nr:phosphatase PAP2 family protein [Mogibacterium sp.]
MTEIIRSADGNLLVTLQELLVREELTPIVRFITHLGDSGMIWILFVLLMLLFRATRKDGLWSGIALAASYIINNLLLKNLIARIRPYEIFSAVQLLVEQQSDFSFPSGHSAASFVVAISMYIYLPKRYGIPALILAFLISLSRIYVGVHYPLDVVCGALSGTLIALITAAVRHRVERNRLQKRVG